MMNTMKRIALLLLTLLLGAGCAAAEISGDYGYTVLDDGTAMITKYAGSDAEIVIPAELNGYAVSAIGKRAFFKCKPIISVVIPGSVTSIGEYAFYGCSSLTSVAIPEGVTSIGNEAFYGCSFLTSVVIPESVTFIGDSAFCNCKSLEAVVIPGSVTSIGNDAFCGCSSLTSVSIPDSVASIGEYAFPKRTMLTVPAGSYAEQWAKENGYPFIEALNWLQKLLRGES
ncbi:MAG: leucine-rich repeat domain-containing protein [Clostridia bacterium]|nr:leucine-rich repeat domain-containing protein [Clostridia bacterium]